MTLKPKRIRPRPFSSEVHRLELTLLRSNAVQFFSRNPECHARGSRGGEWGADIPGLLLWL